MLRYAVMCLLISSGQLASPSSAKAQSSDRPAKKPLDPGGDAAASATPQGGKDTKRECVTASTEGQTDRDEGRLLSAREQFLTCAREQCPAVVRKSCADWLTDVDARTPSVVVSVVDSSGADVSVRAVAVDGDAITLDGRPVRRDPGQHVVKVTLVTGETIERQLLLAEGDRGRQLTITLETDKPKSASLSPRSTRRDAGVAGGGDIPTGSWILGGAAVVGLASFGYFAVAAKQDFNDLTAPTGCSPRCTEDQTHAGRQKAVLADVSLGVAGAALAAAIVWVVLHDPPSPKASASAMGFGVAPLAHGAYATWRTGY